MTGKTETVESEHEIQRQVREFYNRVGWKEVSNGLYQNARYEDLRPVTQEYIHRCHLRVGHHLPNIGRLFLDAGSGPIQYPEYVEYSRGYQKRVCADISILALQSARDRIGEHGAFVVADISRLPFAVGSFDAVVSLHTIHHLPASQQQRAYLDLQRVLAPGGRAAVVNGSVSSLNNFFGDIKAWWKRRAGTAKADELSPDELQFGKGTFTNRLDAKGLRSLLRGKMDFDILIWRSLGTGVLRFFIRPEWGGKLWLRILYRLEEWFPHFFGKRGLYPLVVISK